MRRTTLAALFASLFLTAGVRADAPSPDDAAKQIGALELQLNKYDVADWVNPHFHTQMNNEQAPQLKQELAIIAGLDGQPAAHQIRFVKIKVRDLAALQCLGDDDAKAELTKLAASTNDRDALEGKIGELKAAWWQHDPATHGADLITAAKALAKAHNANDFLAGALLDLTTQSDDLQAVSALEDVVLSMKGPVATHFAAMPNKVGKPFNLSVVTLNGQSVSIAKWKGKVVLLDFWATWCPPCRASLPHLEEMYTQYHKDGLEVLGISNDSVRNDLVAFLKADPALVWPQVFKPSSVGDHWNTIAMQCGVNAIPCVYLIDRNGILRTTTARGREDKLIPALLAEKPAAQAASAQ